MTFSFLQCLIICPLVFAGGFVDAVAGGGGLISLPAYMIAGLPVHNAIATNKLSSGIGTAFTTARFARSGFIPWKLASFCIIGALVGSSLGAHIALLISDRFFRILMLFILPATALYVTRSHVMDRDVPPLPPVKTLLLSIACAFVIGVYDGFYGPGTGTFLLLFLTAAAHLKLTTANGVTKVINLTTNLTALAVYLMNGKVIILLGLIAGLFGLAGNMVGSRFFVQKGSSAVKPLMLLVLCIFFIRIVWELFL